MSRKTAGKKRRRRRVRFPAKQWDMPAGYCADGSGQASLRDVVDPEVATLQLSDLTLNQRAALVVQRIERQSTIELAMIGAGMIDKTRAITEVKNKTRVGRLLIEIEHQMIRNLIEQSQQVKLNNRRSRK
ncbi:MAG TPA: hypothetical protein VJT50_07040 [Pyrinomonadaceae bacterium]|nr:hypothetical protein [Pyrinomonadaceae bacterium]